MNTPGREWSADRYYNGLSRTFLVWPSSPLLEPAHASSRRPMSLPRPPPTLSPYPRHVHIPVWCHRFRPNGDDVKIDGAYTRALVPRLAREHNTPMFGARDARFKRARCRRSWMMPRPSVSQRRMARIRVVWSVFHANSFGFDFLCLARISAICRDRVIDIWRPFDETVAVATVF